jgi:hypothetical protein
MSRIVNYNNQTLHQAFLALDELEQVMGWNLRCAYPDPSKEPADTVIALVQIMQAAAEVRRLVALAEKESFDLFKEQAILIAADEAWNRPDPNVVDLADGRKVAREYYDPKLHGPEAGDVCRSDDQQRQR